MQTCFINNKTFIPLETTELKYLSLYVTAAYLNWQQKQKFADLSSLHNTNQQPVFHQQVIVVFTVQHRGSV